MTDLADVGQAFASEELAPRAAEFEDRGGVPDDVIARLGALGILGCCVPPGFGGRGLSFVEIGKLHELIGAACSSTRSLLTVQGMVSRALIRWGTDEQRSRWLPGLATGEVIAGLAISEPGVGSDAASVVSTAEQHTSGAWELQGEKSWVTFGQRADLFLVLARSANGLVTLLLERHHGLDVVPQRPGLGLRAAMLAELRFRACRVPAENLVGQPGFGLAAVAGEALLFGRYSVAAGCVGIAQAALETSVRHASTRQQFGTVLTEHQLIRRMLSDIAVNTEAARLQYQSAGSAMDAHREEVVERVLMAKYFASRVAVEASRDAVQIHGSVGCAAGAVPERLYRDAKVMQIIEGSDEINQLNICEHVLKRLRRRRVLDV